MSWIVLALVLGQIPQAPPRDTAPAAQPGTGVIRGRVVSADAGLPLRRALVTMMGGQPGAGGTSRTVASDDRGQFEFSALSAGTYRLRATAGPYRAQYLAIAFGAKRPEDFAGTPIELKDGQVFEGVTIALPRAAAIVGRVTDDFGEPVSRAMVYPLLAVPGSTTFRRTAGGFQTDDLGQFRIFGLAPGEYIVGAESRSMGGPPATEGESEGFVTTYYPAALSEREAMRVRLRGAEDVGGIEIRLVRTRTFRITGMVMDSQGRPVARPPVMLIRPTGGTGFSTVGMMSFDQAGRFTIRDVAPGDYRLVVRPAPTGPVGTVSGGMVGGVVGGVVAGSQPQSPTPQEYANQPLSVGSDIDNLLVVTQPAVSITGRIVFADGVPLNVPAGLRVMTQPGDRVMPFGGSSSAPVTPELDFTLNNLMGPLLVRAAGFPPEWAMKSVMLGQTDISDTPIEFTSEHTRHLQIVLTTRASSIEGAITDERGAPVSQAAVVAIPEDQSAWTSRSPRLRVSRLVKDGRFTLSGLLAGRYYVIALPLERAVITPDMGADFFETLTKEATMVLLGEDEKRTVDLRLAKDARE